MATEEIKEINREDCSDLSQAEVSSLRAEIRELSLKLEKANNKLTKRKNELESERENSKTFRKFIQELNNKVQLLERATPTLPPPPPPSPINASIQCPQAPAMHPAVSEEFIERLVMDKTGLEIQVCEQKRQIESLNTKLTQCTDTQQQRDSDLLLKEQQLEECKSDYLKLEGECQLGKQLFKEAQNSLFVEKEQLQQEMDRERDNNKKLCKKMEEILESKQQLEPQMTELLESITENKKRDQKLTNEISFLQNTNKQLDEDLRKLETESKARIEELRETKEKQQQTTKSNNKQHLSEVREKDTSISKLANQLETLQTQFGRERGDILKKKESEQSDLKREFERTKAELRYKGYGVGQQKQELEVYQALCSKQEETADLVGSLISEKSYLEQSIEELKQQNQKLTTEAAEQPDRLTLMGELDTANDLIMKLKQTSSAKEEQLSGKIQELENGNMELTTNINTLNKQISEQNKQITSARGAHEAKNKSLSLLETKDKQKSDLKIQIFEDLGGILNSEEKNEKLLASEKEISSLMEQIDAFRTQIDALTEAKRDNSLRIQELEGSYENLTNTSKDLEMQLGESKSECKKLEMGGEGNSGYSDQLIDQLRKELGASKDELKSERQNSEIGKQLINKLNSDIQNFEKGNAGKNTADLERQLAESERARTAMEHKLGEMATEITNRDAKIRELEQNIGIVQNRSQVAHTTSTPVMPTNPSKTKDDENWAKVSKDLTKQKQTESSGATPGATFYDLTSHIVPVANTTGKSASKILLRPNTHVNVVKLKSLPNPHECILRQAILSINKRYEIGVIMVIFEMPGKVGLRSVTSKYVGIKLNNPVGNSGGEFRTKRYFECEPNCAIFAPLEDVLIPVA